MRASSLSNDQVIERLNRDFINSWIIIPQFENPKEFFKSEEAIQFAMQIEKEFTYPVDSIILSSDGQPLSQGEFAEMHSNRNADAYLEMLGRAKR